MTHPVTGNIGGRLKCAREQRGLSLSDTARRTKLSVSVLQAIERNDFASLPGGMYRKAYLRTVAVELGLDPNEIAGSYVAQCEPAIDPPVVTSHDAALEEKWIEQLTPSPRRSIRTLAILTAAAMAWFMFQPGPPRPKMPLQDSGGGFVPVRMPGAIASALGSAGPRVIAAGHTDVPLRITMEASGWCWVAAEADGERVMYRLVEPGEHVRLEAQRVISLRLGDAGSVRLSINDGASRVLGGHGEVVELELTPDNVEGWRDAGVETAAGAVLLPIELAPQ